MNNQIQQEKIRELAYLFYLERGQQEGSALEDWIRAEKEVAGAVEAKRSEVKRQSVVPEVQKRVSENQRVNSSVQRKY